MAPNVILMLILALAALPCKAADLCTSLTSCSSCIANSVCMWCVTKSKCTQQTCGNDNIIYPKETHALMAGAEFCPKIVFPSKPLTIKSGNKENVVVSITQIHLYMAFTPWKCKISIGERQETVTAALLVDKVFCAATKFLDDRPYTEGNVSVLWDYNKQFDGAMPIRICRCDLAPECSACQK